MWGTITIGGIALREEIEADQDGQVISIAGQESHPPQSRASVLAAHDNLTAMAGLVVPVVFSDKAELSGFFIVSTARSRLLNHANGAGVAATWSATLTRLGGPRDLEIETFIPRIPRLDALAGTQVASFWHAPAVGSLDYFTGPEVPGRIIERTGREGVVRVYDDLPDGIDPRWTIAAEDYMAGAVRLTINDRARIGALTPPEVTSWTVENGLVRLSPAGGAAVRVEAWDAVGGEWASPDIYTFGVNGIDFTATPELTVIRNKAEEVTVRLQYPQTSGRVTVDLSLRRGSRFITGTLKRHSAATLALVHAVANGVGTAVTGGIRRTAADPVGNRWVMGSPVDTNADAAAGYFTRAAATVLPFFIGHEIGTDSTGTATAPGDAYADLLAQYLGSTGERSRVVKRA